MLDLGSEKIGIISNPLGFRLVLAGPGSGKTQTMVELVNSLLKSGIPSSEIRGVTFSRNAAETIQKRTGIKGIFSTFHSLGYEICSEIQRKSVEPQLRHRLLYALTRKWGVDYKVLDRFIGDRRRGNVNPEIAVACGRYDYGLASAYDEYERVRASEGWMDFDSMLCDAVHLLENNDAIRDRWSPRFLIVDEAQDTDNCQWRMMQLMSKKYGNITVVGDPNQCIYGFRGAQPENLVNFDRWFENGETFYLGRNYRSTQTIVNFVRENVPKNAPKNLTSQMVAHRDDLGAAIGLKMYWTEDGEAESALALSQASPRDSIILARTNRVVGLLERLCNRSGIRYHLLGKTGFWKQNEIRKAVTALSTSFKPKTRDALDEILPKIEAKYAVENRTEQDNDALENLQVLRLISVDYIRTEDFISHANKMIHRRNDPRGVSISTVHQAKGGEWKNVYLIGAKAGAMPHKNGEPSEEERIWFVALSRAIDKLRISFTGTPSPYLRKYLDEKTLDALREKANEVESIQKQNKLFS